MEKVSPILTLYIGGKCPLCQEAAMVLTMISRELGWTMNTVDIYDDPQLLERYQLMIPVAAVNGEPLQYGQIYYGEFMETLAAKDYLK